MSVKDSVERVARFCVQNAGCDPDTLVLPLPERVYNTPRGYVVPVSPENLVPLYTLYLPFARTVVEKANEV